MSASGGEVWVPAGARAALTAQQRARLQERLRAASERSAAAPSAIPRRTSSAPPPLSFAQRRLWFLDQLVPEDSFYNVPAALPIDAAIDPKLLRRCLNEIVRRHESLRTTFRAEVGGEPAQIIAPRLEIDFPVIDLRSIPESSRQAEVTRLATEEARLPFNLMRGPLVRAAVLRVDAKTSVLLLTMHHIIADGWSMGVLFRELLTLYDVFAANRPSPLPELPIQYADFAIWQSEWLQGEVLERQIAYWRKQLDAIPQLRMPIDRPRPVMASFRGAMHEVHIPEETTRELRRIGHEQNATLFMVLLAAFDILLQRYTGQDDIVVGAPVANRNRAEIEPLIGFFVNSQVLRTDLSGDPSFLEVLSRVRAVALDAYANQDVPFEKLVEALQPERDLSRNPFCQVTLQLQNAPNATGVLPEGDERHVDVVRGTAILDLACSLWETRRGLAGSIEYSTDLFLPTTIERFAAHYVKLLAEIVAHPSRRIGEYELLRAEERQRIVVEWNATAADFPIVPVHELIEQQVRRLPDATAVSMRMERLTYRELDERANRLARALQSRGVGRDSIVALWMPRSFDFVIAMLGVLKAGGAYLPVDLEQPPMRLSTVLDDARVTMVLTSDMLAQLTSELASIPATAPPCPATPDSLAYVLYTSGSTGVPKGAMIPHRAICNHMQWMARDLPLRADDCVLQRTPLHFDASVWELLAPLCSGSRMALFPPAAHTDPSAISGAMETEQVTILQVVPSLLRMLLDEPAFGAAARRLRRLFCGGEELPKQLVQRARQCTSAEIYNLYGPTEAAIDSTYWKCGEEEGERIPIGRPIANACAYILDRRQQPVPIGVAGELYIGGAGVGRGYVGESGFTARSFLRDFMSGDRDGRLYRTGDRARFLHDGRIEFLGRVDGQVKLRGHRIELGEIAHVLETHPAVGQVAVIMREDVPDEQTLVAYATKDPRWESPEGGEALHDAHVRDWMAVYEHVYGDDGASADAELNTVGWMDSAEGYPIPAEQMRSWLDETVRRIEALRPSRVLDIGCGTGMVLHRIAPMCQRYFGVDFSAPALRLLRESLRRAPSNLAHVTLAQRRADELEDLAAGSFDVVVLNSVAQYFPSITYLLRVLENAVRLVGSNGYIFAGDIRNLHLLRAFYASIEVSRAADDTPLSTIRELVAQRQLQEKELAIAPSFFAMLPHLLPAITAVWLQPKCGQYLNEMTRFRYDVVLRVGGGEESSDLRWLDWRRQKLSFADIHRTLSAECPPVLGVTGVPSSHVSGAVALARALEDDDPSLDARRLRELASEHERDGYHEADVRQIEEELGYETHFRWLRSSPDGELDLIFRRGDAPITAHLLGRATAPSHRDVVLRHLANDPLHRLLEQRLLAPELQQWAQERLPSYMVPSTVMILDALPLKSNGKVDRAALPAPEYARVVTSRGFVAPRMPVEQVVAGVWTDVLHVQKVGVEDDFFSDLGGHSLLATQLASRLREVFDIDLPLRLVFQFSTIAAFCDALLADPARAAEVEDTARLVIELEQMPDGEVERMLTSYRAREDA